jgi:outer membrane cobalamin receptor
MKKICIIAVYLLLLASSIKAKKTPTLNIITLPLTTVTAKRLPDNNNLKSSAVSIITKKEIENTPQKTIADILETEAGFIKYDMTGSRLDPTLSLRGFNTGKDIVVVLDGIKLNEPDESDLYWQYIPETNIERIEILKSADSSVFGSGAFGGVINIITDKKKESLLDCQVGNYGYTKKTLKIANYLNNFYYSLLLNQAQEKGYRNKSDYTKANLATKVSYHENNHILEFDFKKFKSNMNYADALTYNELQNNRAQASPAWDTRTLEGDITSLYWHFNPNQDLKFSINTNLKQRLSSFTSAARGSLGNNVIDDDVSTLGQVIQINFKKSIIIGAENNESRINSITYNFDKNTRIKGDKAGHIQSFKNETALFATYYQTIDNLYFKTSIRKDKISYNPYDKFNSIKKANLKFTKTTKSGEVGFNINTNFLTYVAYGESYKAPSFYNLFYNAFGSNENLKPEFAKTRSIGLKYQTTNLKLELTNFETAIEDEIVYITNFDTFSGQSQNIQKSKRQGNELKASFLPANNIKLSGAITKMESKIQNGYTDNWITYTSDNLEGLYIPMTPDLFYTFKINYQLENTVFELQNIYVSSQYQSFDNLNKAPKMGSYNISNLHIRTKTAPNQEIYLNIHNLFNYQYISRTIYSAGTSYYNPADLRSYSLGYKVNF